MFVLALALCFRCQASNAPFVNYNCKYTFHSFSLFLSLYQFIFHSLLPLNLRHRHLISLKFSTTKISAIISVDDKLPESTLSYFDAADELQTLTISDLTKNKKTILFAVPGAFTPTCSQKHLPEFVSAAAELKSKGIDTIAYVSVNDAFVMKAWKKGLEIEDKG
ncbi:hypothetical protein ACSBR2_002753 [Camellia fascicularis]